MAMPAARCFRTSQHIQDPTRATNLRTNTRGNPPMSPAALDSVVQSLLYDGYLLYPYRRSAIKNQHRWNFGVVYPASHSAAQHGAEPYSMTTECLVLGNDSTQLDIAVRFLQLKTCDEVEEVTERKVVVSE